MRTTALLASCAALSAVSATPYGNSIYARGNPTVNHDASSKRDDSVSLAVRDNETSNPFEGKVLFANPEWAAKLERTHQAFVHKSDFENAYKVRTIQNIGSFVWVSNIAGLSNIDGAIAAARSKQQTTGVKQIVGLVLYNLPDRDCSAGESAGELVGAEGLSRYKTEFIAPYAEKVSSAKDLTFAIVLEPDSLGNLVTNMGVERCAAAASIYKEGIAHAISSLQFDNVHLYIDAAHGGWLGWADNLAPSAAVFAEVVQLANGNNTNGAKIRGFSTNVSNYNPFHAIVRENYTEWSPSWDENNYALSLAPHLEAAGLPSRFIIDQGRVANPGAREEWGEWCNVAPAGFGQPPGASTNNTYVDSIVWIKPGGESDGRCGYPGAPAAGAWFDEYAQLLTENAHPDIKPIAH
jgi:cellulose 1,4-beta-cellobiosidase